MSTTLSIDSHTYRADRIDLPGEVSILVIQARRGFLACGYVSLAAAEKFGHAAATVSGVSSYDDMLAATVRAVSPAAEALGVRPGIPGSEALALLD